MKLKSSLFIIISFLVSCSTITPVSNFTQSQQELMDILKTEKLSPKAEVVIKHASNDLAIANKQQVKNEKLQDKVIEESELAGTGKLTYVLIGLGALGLLTFIVWKVKS